MLRKVTFTVTLIMKAKNEHKAEAIARSILGQRLEDAVEGEPESDGTELKEFEITHHPTESSADTKTKPQQAAISDIIESAIYWISEDADRPVTPPAEWQAVIPLLHASPKMQRFITQVASGNTEYRRLQEIAKSLLGEVCS